MARTGSYKFEILADTSRLEEALDKLDEASTKGLANAAWHLAVGLEKRIAAIEKTDEENAEYNVQVEDDNKAADHRLRFLEAKIAELEARPLQVVRYVPLPPEVGLPMSRTFVLP